MKTFGISATALLFTILIAYILYLTQCKGGQPCPPSPVRTAVIDTQRIINQYEASTKPKEVIRYLPGDTIYKQKIIPGKSPQPIFVEVVKQIPIKVDTQAIINDYYSKRVQEDSISKGNLKIKTSDTLYKNQIIGRQWYITSTETTITKTLLPQRLFYFGGGGYHSDTAFISGAHVDLGYINRRGQHIKVDILRMGNHWHYGASFYQTIKFH